MRATPIRNVEVIDASATDVATRVRELTGGKGADIVFNTVGDPYFEAAHKSLALRGRQILIAAIDRIVQFNILEFYRGQHTYVGIDTLGLSSVATGAVLRELGPGFASGHLKPFPIKASAVYPLEQAQGGIRRGRRFVARPRDPEAVTSWTSVTMDTAASSSSPRLAIGLVYGAVGLLSGFCLMSSMRGWLAEGDGRLVRTYALAIGVAIAATQVLAAAGLVDLGKSIYLQPTFSAPVMFLGGLLFGYGMVLSNGCGSRALVLLGRGNLRSFVVVIVLAIVAQMTLKGLIAPARIAHGSGVADHGHGNSLPALLAALGLGRSSARMLAASVVAAALIIFAFAHPAFRRSPGQIAAGIMVGLLVAAGWFVTGYLGADDFNPAPVTSLTFIAPIADALQYVMLSTGSTLNFGIVTVVRRVRRQPRHGARHRPLQARRLSLAAPHAAFGLRRGADGRRRRDGVRLLGRAGADGLVDAGAGVVRRVRGHLARHRRGSARRAARPAAGGGLLALLRRLRHDPDLRRQRPVHRAFVGDLHQPLALLGVELAVDRDLALDLVEHAVASSRTPRNPSHGSCCASASP